MYASLPLDDLIGKILYIEGAPWRLRYDRSTKQLAFKRVAPPIPTPEAIALIEAGAILWQPPEEFEPLLSDTSLERVQQHVQLLDAFRRSPLYRNLSNRDLQEHVEGRLAECRSWLARRALPSGDAYGDTLDAEGSE